MVMMIMKPHLKFILFVFALLLFSGCSKEAARPPLVKIMVAVPEGAIVEGENPVYIEPGGTARFALSISAGFGLVDIETAGAFYENGEIRLEGALYPSTIRLDVRPVGTKRFFIENNIKMGTATSDTEQGRLPLGTHITVCAEAAEGSIFIGWSKGELLAKGGQFLSHSPEYSFTLDSDTFLYPNYLSQSGRYIKYNANGGSLAGSGADLDSMYSEINTKHYPCPNALGDTGLFSREGYALLGYNTAPDGSGMAVGLGGHVDVDTLGEGTIELFLQWVKYSDFSLFTYTKSGDKMTITGYLGDEETIVIPEQIDGFPVSALSRGAIQSKSCKTLFLTRNITSVLPGAIADCANLTTLYISDSVTDMANESISGCPELSGFYINAVIAPRYFTSPGWGSSIKYKRLITAPGKRLIVISGSSSAFGLNSPVLEELLGGEYSVVNYGTHAGSCALFFLEFTADQLREGDVVVMAPEPVWDSQLGANWLDSLTFQLLEGAYDAFRHVDIRNFANVFAAFAEYNAIRSNMSKVSYNDYISDVNIYGDILTNQADHPADYVAGGQWVSFNDIMTEAHAARLNRVNETVLSKGGRLYLSCSPVNRNALVEGADTKQKQAAYMANIARLVDFPVISFPGDYIFPGNFFSDTDHHLNAVHSADRSLQLAKDLKAQFEAER